MQDLEQEILRHLKERGWDNLRPGDIAKSIMIEGAELLEHFQWENPALEDVRQNSEKITEIKKELADIFIYAIEMAVLLGINVTEIIRTKLEHVAKKYPAELMKRNAQKGSGSGEDSEYWRIKRAYRQQGQ